MNPFSASHKTQGIRSHDPYLFEQTSGVCLQNTVDYSPFGLSLDGRTVDGDFYRYGFQNQEKDEEFKGKGNSLNFEFRIYDPRVGRFFAVDPLFKDNPANGTYVFSENRVIDKIEYRGLEAVDIDNPILDTGNKILTGTISSVCLAVTSIGAPIARVIYESSTGKLGYDIAPQSFSENWEFVSRTDLMGEELTPEQGRDIITSTANTIFLFAPIKISVSSSVIPDKLLGMGLKTGAKKAVKSGMNMVVEADKNKPKTKLDYNTEKIEFRKEILHDHIDQLEIMKQNKKDYSYEDFTNIYESIKHDYGRLETLREERKTIINEKK